MRKIFISAGHSNRAGRDRGAAANGFIEGELTVDARNRLANQLRLRGHIPLQDGNDTVLKDTLTWLRNRTTNKCIVLDLHWNAGPSKATGIEVLIPAEHTEFEVRLAADIAKALSDTLGLPLRGALTKQYPGSGKVTFKGVKTELESHHGRLGWMRLTGENILIEFCFISNSRDMSSWIQNRDKACSAIAEVLDRWSKV
jgi:N-acetylmuramoyl-L-alanine amidase